MLDVLFPKTADNHYKGYKFTTRSHDRLYTDSSLYHHVFAVAIFINQKTG